MDYAIILGFDKKTEDKFRDITEAIADSGVNRYMLDNKIPPHVTISCVCTEDVAPVIAALDRYCAKLKPGELFWPSLGSFAPSVLFAAPVLNEYLMNACIGVNKLVKKYAEIGDSGHYLPYQWVPHTTLAYKLNEAELKKAFEVAVQHFSAFGGKTNRLILAQCNPYKKLQTWEFAN